MSHPRYRPVPQIDEIINLDNQPPYNYAYNTGDVPTSPPPSFHSSQSTVDLEHDRAFNTPTPTPVPTDPNRPSAASARTTGSSSDAELMLNLHQRIERLEESMGRLLLEKSTHHCDAADAAASRHRSNCCVNVALDLPAAERHEMLRSESNCCVTFGSMTGAAAKRQQKLQGRRVLVLAALWVVGLWLLGLGAFVVVMKAMGGPECAGCAVTAAGAGTGAADGATWVGNAEVWRGGGDAGA